MNFSVSKVSNLPPNCTVTSVGQDRLYEVLDVLELAFPDVSRTFFHAIITNDPWCDSPNLLAVEYKSTIVSTLQLLPRKLSMASGTIPFLGIGAVATHPDYQNKGFSTALLQTAEKVIQENGFQGGMLYTKIHPYYERLGWTTIHQQEVDINVASLRPYRPRRANYRRVRKEDHPTLHKIYTHMQSIHQGSLIRTIEYWNVRPLWMNHAGLVILDDEDSVVAYLYGAKYREQEPIFTITEFGFLHPCPAMIKSMLGAAAILAEENRCSTVRGFMLHNRDLVDRIQLHQWMDSKSGYDYAMWLDCGMRSHEIQLAVDQNRWVYWQTDAF